MKPRFSLKKYGVMNPIKVSVNTIQLSPSSVVRNKVDFSKAESLAINPTLSFIKYEL
jgi:hypothetical protein